MTGILTNGAALASLQNLSATQKALGVAQSQVASGLRIASASDGAAYWSIASTMRSDTGALAAVSDALSLGASVVGTAAAAIASTLKLLNRIKADLVTAQQPGASRASVQTDIAAQQKSLVAVLSSASFNGVNLLDGSAGAAPPGGGDQLDEEIPASQVQGATLDSIQPIAGPVDPIRDPIHPIADTLVIDTSIAFVTSFQRAAGGGTSIGTVSLDTAATNLIGAGGVLSGAPGNFGSTVIVGMDVTASGASLATMQADTEAAIASVAAVGALVGGIGSTIAGQQSYVAALSDALSSGIGSLVDADMNVAATRLQALQTRQQLGAEALSIANGDSRLVLKLFEAA